MRLSRMCFDFEECFLLSIPSFPILMQFLTTCSQVCVEDDCKHQSKSIQAAIFQILKGYETWLESNANMVAHAGISRISVKGSCSLL